MKSRAPKAFACISLLLVTARAEVVINELHYDPADKTVPLEFVELHNTAATNVSLSGWHLTSGIDFVFPSGAQIPARGFLVVAENPAALQTAFNVPALGPFAGSLSNEGERLVLRDAAGATVDEVTYGVGFPWPTASRGAGASLELLHPALDNDLAGSWRASQTTATVPESQIFLSPADPSWRYRKGTSEPATTTGAWRQLGFPEDASWLTGQTAIGYGDGDDNTVLPDMLDNYTSIYLRHNFVAQKIPAVLQLNVTIDDGFVAWINGIEVARFNVNEPSPAFNSSASGSSEAAWQTFLLSNISMLRAGTNLLAIHVLNQSLGSSDLTIDAELRTPDPSAVKGRPTPGRANSVLLPNASTAAPLVRQVAHTPQQPTNAQPVTISAKVTDLDGVAQVNLSYQVVRPGQYVRKSDAAYNNNWITLPMTDDGAHGTNGDLVAGDSIYTVLLPASVSVHRTLVRYRIVATDTLNNALQVPYPDDESPNFAFFVYDGAPGWRGASKPGTTPVRDFPRELMNSLPIYHLLANQTDVSNSQWNGSYDTVRMWGTLVYDGEVYDHVQFHNRGEGSTYNTGKNKWRFHFNRARDFKPRDNYGRRYKADWNSMNFDACASPWAAVNRGMAGLDEAISYRLYELAGVPSSKTHYLHFRVIDNAVEASPTSQYEGDLWGLYLAVEQPDGRFLDERGLPDGNVYKIEGGGDKKNQGATQATNTSDWNAFSSASRGSQTEAWWRTNMNMPVFYSFHAMNRVTGNVDLRQGYNHYFYHHPDGRWMIMPWDMDMMFIAETHWPGIVDQNNSLARPALALEFKNRCREILDLMCSDANVDGGQVGQLIDEFAEIVNPRTLPLTWADVDEAMWNWNPQTRGANQPSGQTDHKGNFYRTPFTDSRMGGNWIRTLATPNHEGFVKFIRDYTTDTDPNAFTIGDGDQRGYGFNFLEREATDPAIPNRPAISFAGAPNFPVNGLRFQCSPFSDPQGADTFASLRWRLAEIYSPTASNYVTGEPRKYELTAAWESPEITNFSSEFVFPLTAARPGLTYRARVQMKDNTGRWSRWSEPVQFTAAGADLSIFTNSIAITEILYAPSAPSATEAAAGYTASDFEFIEIKNLTDTELDLTGLRFTKGIDWDFVQGATLPARAYAIIARNAAALTLRYGTNLLILGSYTPDSLANEGENVKLSYGAGAALHEFSYEPTLPWPNTTNGRSIVLIAPEKYPDPRDPLQWRPSLAPGGSPGTNDSQSFTQWKAAHGIQNDLDDADGDGLNALIEYAIGSDPAFASSENAPLFSYEKSLLTLAVHRDLKSDDVRHFIESSTDLETWMLSTNIITAMNITGATQQITCELPMAQSRQVMFFRVSFRPR